MDTRKIKTFAHHTHTGWRWFLWGLRWLSVVVFIALLLVGISVKLPWKVLVCLAIIPVVGIFVPQKIQPWIWMALTLILLSAWIWVKLPGSASGDWHVYQFDQEYDALQADRQIALTDNAAVRYQALFDTYDESIFYYPVDMNKIDDAVFDSPWDSAQYPLMAEWLTQYDPALDTLLDMTQMPDCQFPIPQNLPAMEVQMKRINRMKGWAHLLLWSANRDIAEGRPEQALEKQHAVLNMGRHLYQQQNLLDQSSAFHIELFAARAMETFMIEYCEDPETLQTITDSFAEIDTGWAKSWAAIVDHEKLMAKNIMGLFYEVNDNGRTRIAHGSMYALQEGLGYQPQRLFFRQHEMNRLAVIGLWLSLPTSPQRIAKLIDERFDYYSLQVQKGTPLPVVPIQYSWRMGLNVRSAIDWLAVDRVKYFWALHGQNSRHQSLITLMQIFSALKQYSLRHHNWPDSLQVLQLAEIETIDPVYDRSYRYQKTDDGFRLYSLGPNGIDDDGVNDPRKNKDDIVFWPRMMMEENFNRPPRPQKAS